MPSSAQGFPTDMNKYMITYHYGEYVEENLFCILDKCWYPTADLLNFHRKKLEWVMWVHLHKQCWLKQNLCCWKHRYFFQKNETFLIYEMHYNLQVFFQAAGSLPLGLGEDSINASSVFAMPMLASRTRGFRPTLFDRPKFIPPRNSGKNYSWTEDEMADARSLLSTLISGPL